MSKGLLAQASVTINAPVATVWNALVNPERIKQYMFGTETISDWKQGSSIVWKGLLAGKPYQDRGVIQKIDHEHILEYTHFSPLSGARDLPENYHTLTYLLNAKGEQTQVSLTQDNNTNAKMMEHSQKMWETMLVNLKALLEK